MSRYQVGTDTLRLDVRRHHTHLSAGLTGNVSR